MVRTYTDDVKKVLFAPIQSRIFSATVSAERRGIIAGSCYAGEKLRDLGVKVEYLVPEGEFVEPGTVVARFCGNPSQVTIAEERIMGDMAKFSGIATAARRAVELADGQCRIASGSWKKMPEEIKQAVRDAIILGGASPRLLDVPFLYLDKNYVRIFGSITATLSAAEPFADRKKVIQLKGETGSVREETTEALKGGADVIMVDTGVFADVDEAIDVIEEQGVRDRIMIAFARDLSLDDIPLCISKGIDLLCIGKEIIDAPLLDMKLDILR